MDDKTKQDFAKRIENANPLQLTLINHELLLYFMDEASAATAGTPECTAALERARAALAELHAALDMDIEFSNDLGNLYLFVNKCLIHAGIKQNDDEKNNELTQGRGIITELLAAWQTLESDKNLQQRIADASQRVFAGLTYGKDGQLEEYQDFDPNSGYKA